MSSSNVLFSVIEFGGSGPKLTPYNNRGIELTRGEGDAYIGKVKNSSKADKPAMYKADKPAMYEAFNDLLKTVKHEDYISGYLQQIYGKYITISISSGHILNSQLDPSNDKFNPTNFIDCVTRVQSLYRSGFIDVMNIENIVNSMNPDVPAQFNEQIQAMASEQEGRLEWVSFMRPLDTSSLTLADDAMVVKTTNGLKLNTGKVPRDNVTLISMGSTTIQIITEQKGVINIESIIISDAISVVNTDEGGANKSAIEGPRYTEVENRLKDSIINPEINNQDFKVLAGNFENIMTGQIGAVQEEVGQIYKKYKITSKNVITGKTRLDETPSSFSEGVAFEMTENINLMEKQDQVNTGTGATVKDRIELLQDASKQTRIHQGKFNANMEGGGNRSRKRKRYRKRNSKKRVSRKLRKSRKPRRNNRKRISRKTRKH
jgi:hypothetical protein